MSEQPYKRKPLDRTALDAIGLNLINDLANEKPNHHEFQDWIEAKAQAYGLTVQRTRQILNERNRTLQLGIGEQTAFRAHKIASAAGATFAKAMRVVSQALDATKHNVRFNKDGDKIYDEEVPDWATRLRAVENICEIRGAYAPQQIDVTHGVTDQLASLTVDQLKVRIMELAASLQAEKQPAVRQIEGKRVQ